MSAVGERTTSPATSSFLDLTRARFDYEPFPIGVAAGVIAPDRYRDLMRSWPANDLFEFKPKLGKKYSLSEVNNRRGYLEFLRARGPWREFYDAVKDPAFVGAILALLAERRIDLGLDRRLVARTHRLSALDDRLRDLAARARHPLDWRRRLSARFEFSMLPADGGHIKPHTDAPQKFITLVVSMTEPGDWNPAWGGGTDVLRPKDRTVSFNHMNRQLEFDEVDTLGTFEFLPNQCVVFVKTFNSWHAVKPMTGPANVMRRTLTINIEEPGP